ncbi:MAG: YidB family protein [Campylobacterota bacterium]|nr:YidB family protein [Campylobacterota bacterium]
MDFMSLAKDLLAGQGGEDANNMMGAFSKLIGEGESMDMDSLIGSMKSGDSALGDIASSWLGNGENLPISKEQVSSLFGSGDIADFASKLGLESDSAVQSISEMLPKLIDGASSDGSLLPMNSMEDIMGLAQKFFS